MNCQLASPEYLLGLDIGANSVGWALIALEDGQPTALVRTGVRVFEAGVEGDIERGADESRAKGRREARSRRRMLDRRGMRLYRLASELQQAGLLPHGPLATEADRLAFFADLDRTLADGHKNRAMLPYRLRRRALDQPLQPYELGRALYHLAHRRGFLSTRKATRKTAQAEKDEGKVKKAIGELAEQMQNAGARTLGEYLAGLNPADERIRSRYTSRQMYEDEFQAIWQAQTPHHPGLLTDDLKKKVHRAIFHQRPLKLQKHLIGECELEPGRTRCPTGLLAAQRFRMLQKVNDLEAITPDGEIRKLTPDERARLLDALDTRGDMTFSQIRTLLKLKGYHFNFERAGDKLIGNRTAAKLVKVFGDRWASLSPADKDRIVHDLHSIQNPNALAKRGTHVWGLDEAAAQSFAEITLEPGHISLSRQALAKLLPLMEQGIPYATARKQVYGDPPKPRPCDLLPPLTDPRAPDLRNPAVQRALTEVRKVVNGIIRQYGKPAFVRIELARELKNPRQRRKTIWQRNEQNRRDREEAVRRMLNEEGIQNPSGLDIEKWLLAEECNWRCPYTGKPINPHSILFSDTPQFDVEHIIPFSRCLDNSFVNKTLCYAKENREVKHNKTPWEAYGAHPERWAEIIQRVSAFRGSAAKAKLQRFQLKDVANLEDFASRQLVDTAYASRLAVQYLALLYGAGADGVDPQGTRRVQAGRGQVTAYLRNEWGLNAILGDGGDKPRTDHRHHAIDAVAIALTDPKTTKMLSDAAVRPWEAKRRRFKPIPPPWPSFFDDVRQAVENLVVSHRVNRRVRGQMHDETHYSKLHLDPNGRPCTHVRKRVDALTTTELEHIVDDTVKARVKSRLAELGMSDPTKAFGIPENYPYLESKNGRKIPIRSVRIRKYDATITVGSGLRERRVISGSNHHVEILEVKDNKGNLRWDGVVVSTYEAMRRLRAGQPVVQRDHGPDKRFLFSLARGEVIEITQGDHRVPHGLYVVRVVNAGSQRLEFVQLNDARKKAEILAAGDWKKASWEPLRRLGCRKVVVTPLGEVRNAND